MKLVAFGMLFLLTANLSAHALEFLWFNKKTKLIDLALPLDCSLNQDCFVLYYPDRIVNPDYGDYRCGGLSFDNNRATIFAVKPRLNSDEESIPVLAAADGVVEAVVFKEKNIFIQGVPFISIKHRDSYETKYAQVKANSIAVKKGQKVKQGDVIAYTEKGEDGIFNELNFTVFKNNRVVDPAVGAKASLDCNVVEKPLWQNTPPYTPITLVNYSFTSKDSFRTNISFNLRTWGLQKGDQEEISMFDPSGRIVNESSNLIDEGKNLYSSELSLDKGSGTTLSKGLWVVKYKVVRRGKVIYQVSNEFNLD